jgi:anti-anti-sigma factor
MTAKPPSSLHVRRERSDSAEVLVLSGELDIVSAGHLETTIAELCADGVTRLRVEMEELSFMDSTGLRSLLVSAELCEVNGSQLTIGRLSPQVQRLLEISGVGDQLARDTEQSEHG